MNENHRAISRLCAELGRDRLLVQGAGGNISWKEDGVIWVKGSGAWLAMAEQEDIFVPVDLNKLQDGFSQKNFETKPQVITAKKTNELKPSIETNLHALMPQKIVVHLHAIDVLSYLVVKDCFISLQKLFEKATNSDQISYIFLEYHKPGSKLAQAIFKALQTKKNANVAFLKNHGIVLGAESINEIYSLLESINLKFAPKYKISEVSYPFEGHISASSEYVLFPNVQAQALVINPDFYKRLQFDWVLFPDHAVFLGPKAYRYSSWAAFEELEKNNTNKPELIFIQNTGIFVKPSFSQAKAAQLLCYYDVISRILPGTLLDPLDKKSIYALLNWDSEKLRQKMSNWLV